MAVTDIARSEMVANVHVMSKKGLVISVRVKVEAMAFENGKHVRNVTKGKSFVRLPHLFSKN